MSKSDKFWDSKAKGYAESPISDELTYQKKLRETQATLSTGMQVLEFGCGTGTTAVYHAPYVQHIYAIDISEKMIEIGRNKAREADIDNITFSRGTLQEFNAKADSLDAVLGLNVIHLMEDWQSAITEVARILKPGGVFVSSTACIGHSYLRFIKLLAPIGKRLGLMPDVFVLTESTLLYEIKKAGFSIEKQWSHGKNGISVFIIARKI
ncbi:methyltransferase domain-containing protein [Reinekea marina]|uniref:Class I SAM-dependent methyltransferase n=1 Tax=Reinekea marina TaxID=1310421 RepID=A0ABV7WT99_9GAMM|nr:class I SAM-dependent methyltransferase [Reinekea marina]MDN3649683.1 methyltransferase domain-containing protein [Reinekea marina]